MPVYENLTCERKHWAPHKRVEKLAIILKKEILQIKRKMKKQERESATHADRIWSLVRDINVDMSINDLSYTLHDYHHSHK